MKKATILIFLLFIGLVSKSQEDKKWEHLVGINLLGIPATTLDLTYEFSNNARYSYALSAGYTFDYANNFDFIGFALSPHSKCGNDGYTIKKQSGAFLRLGGKFNFRKSFEKESYFFIGAYFVNSLIYEDADLYLGWENPSLSEIINMTNTTYVLGISAIVGYQFKISNRFFGEGAGQFSKSSNIDDLYGYKNYIPGIGYKETCGSCCNLFPNLMFSLKYKL